MSQRLVSHNSQVFPCFFIKKTNKQTKKRISLYLTVACNFELWLLILSNLGAHKFDLWFCQLCVCVWVCVGGLLFPPLKAFYFPSWLLLASSLPPLVDRLFSSLLFSLLSPQESFPKSEFILVGFFSTAEICSCCCSCCGKLLFFVKKPKKKKGSIFSSLLYNLLISPSSIAVGVSVVFVAFAMSFSDLGCVLFVCCFVVV